ncbi:hypothetical protein BLOT_007289 [Blomia tropicalis]|nr:hypothetical protein BLOT_007289 [Blomia tropicalis]
MMEAPGKSAVVRRRLWMVHARPASIGVVVSSISLPYKHKPASNRNESRAPSPANFTTPESTSDAGPCNASKLDSVIIENVTSAFGFCRIKRSLCSVRWFISSVARAAFETTYNVSCFLFTIRSSMIPPVSVVYNVREPVFGTRPSTSATTTDSKNLIRSLPRTSNCNIWDTSNIEAFERSYSVVRFNGSFDVSLDN